MEMLISVAGHLVAILCALIPKDTRADKARSPHAAVLGAAIRLPHAAVLGTDHEFDSTQGAVALRDTFTDMIGHAGVGAQRSLVEALRRIRREDGSARHPLRLS